MEIDNRHQVRLGWFMAIGTLAVLSVMHFVISKIDWPSAAIAWGLRVFVTAPLTAFAALVLAENFLMLTPSERRAVLAAVRDRCPVCGDRTPSGLTCGACGAPRALDFMWSPMSNIARDLFIGSLSVAMFAGAFVLGAGASLVESVPSRIGLGALPALAAWIGLHSARSMSKRVAKREPEQRGVIGHAGWSQGASMSTVSVRISHVDGAVEIACESHLEHRLPECDLASSTQRERALAWMLFRTSMTRAVYFYPHRVTVRRWTLRLPLAPSIAADHYRASAHGDETSELVDGVRIGATADVAATFDGDDASLFVHRADRVWLAPVRALDELPAERVEAMIADAPDESEFRDEHLLRWLAAVRAASG